MPYGKLSDREVEILRGVLEGKTGSEIAAELGISYDRVKQALFYARGKMEAPGDSRLAAERARADGQI